MEPSSPAPPAWVCKRDGRLVPFESDKISRSLFAATERLGRPDAFLARELTDGVLHFLTAETDGAIPTTAQIAELVAKVVRELGQPALAQAYGDGLGKSVERDAPPVTAAAEAGEGASLEVVVRFPADEPLESLRRACARAYALKAVFTRDLAAAQDDGLLTLAGLENPLELAACVLGPPRAGEGMVESFEAMRRVAGGWLAIDGPEYVLWHGCRTGGAAVAEYVRELGIGLRATGLRTVINLNIATPPAWADDLAEGPLFAGQRHTPEPDGLAALTEALTEELRARGLWAAPAERGAGPPPLRIDWHLAERDFLPGADERLLRLARPALEGAPLAFVFDRPRRPVSLAEGLDRRHLAVLLLVGLHLPRLADQPGLTSDPERFLQKLGSLARLALSAAAQKRDFLRHRHGDRTELTRGFLLDRSRLAVAPVGLDSVVRVLTGHGMCAGGPSLNLGRQIVKRLEGVLRQDGRLSQLDTCLDSSADFTLDARPGGLDRERTGLTPWDGTATVKSQLRTAAALHAVAEAGTAAVLLAEGGPPAAEQLASWLRWAWQQTDVVRVRFVRAAPAPQQLTFGVGESAGPEKAVSSSASGPPSGR